MPLPPRSRKKLIKLACAAAIGIVALTAFCLRDVARELWYIHLLGSGDGWRQRDAIEALGEMRSHRAIPHLIEMVRAAGVDEGGGPVDFGWDPDPYPAIPTALARIGPEGIQAVVKLLDDDDPNVQEAALNLIPALGAGAADVLPAVVRYVQSERGLISDGILPDAWLWSTAVETLTRLGPIAVDAVPAVVDSLGSVEDLYSPVVFLEQFPDEATTHLVDALKDGSETQRARILEILSDYEIQLDGRRIVTAVAPLLRSPDRKEVLIALRILRNFSKEALTALPPVLELFDELEPEAHEDLSAFVAELGVPALPRVLAELPGAGEPLLLGLLAALGWMDLRTDENQRRVAETVIPYLTDPREAVRDQAVWTLGALGDGNSGTFEALLRTFERGDGELRVEVLEAMDDLSMTDLQEQTFQTLLEETLEKGDSLVRLEALGILLSRFPASYCEIAANTVLRSLRSGAFREQRAALRRLVDPRCQTPETLQETLAILDSIPELRDPCLDAIAQWKHGREAAVPVVTEILRYDDDDNGHEIAILEFLRRLGKPAAAAAPVVRGLLRHVNTEVRTKAAIALWALDLEAYESTLPVLRSAGGGYEVVHDLMETAERSAVLVGAAMALWRVLDSGTLSGSSLAIRDELGDTARKIGEEALPPLIFATADKSPAIRGFAATLIGELDVPSEPAVRTLLRLFRDAKLDVRLRAVRALRELEPGSDLALQELLSLLEREESSSIRSAVLDGLSRSGRSASAALDTIRPFLDDPEDEVRVAAARAFWKVTGDPKVARRTLLAILEDRSSAYRDDAAEALWDMGPEHARVAVPALVRALEGGPFQLAETSMSILLDLAPDLAAEHLPRLVLRAREEGDPFFQLDIRWGPPAIPALLPLLEDRDADWRLAALDTLTRIGVDPERILPRLRKLLGDPNSEVRSLAVSSLASLGAGGRAALSDLLPLAADPDAELREEAVSAIAALGVVNDAVIDALVRAVGDDEWSVSRAAVEALGELGADSEEVIRALRRATHRLDRDVRRSATEVLSRLELARDAEERPSPDS